MIDDENPKTDVLKDVTVCGVDGKPMLHYDEVHFDKEFFEQMKGCRTTSLAEKVIDALKGSVFPKEVKYSEVPLFPEKGPGIYAITEGPGRHIAEDFVTYDVQEGDVYALVETGT